VIEAELARDLPFLATTRVLTASVDRGLGREEAHELVKEHAVSAALDRREMSGAPGLVDRLADDERIPLDRGDIEALLANPAEFTGTAIDQVRRIVSRVDAIVARHPEAAAAVSEVRV
jgi:adenylosuccinate lyase